MPGSKSAACRSPALALAGRLASIEVGGDGAAAMPNRCLEMTERRSSCRPDLPGQGRAAARCCSGGVRSSRVWARRPRWRSGHLCRPYAPQLGTRSTSASGTSTRRRTAFPRLRWTRPAIRRGASSRSTSAAGRAPEHRLFAEVHIPAHKRRSYDLCKALFDNYRLDQTKPENNRPEEAREILALLEAVTDGPPMLRRASIWRRESGARYSRDAWQELIFELWFRQFDDGPQPRPVRLRACRGRRAEGRRGQRPSLLVRVFPR